MLPLETKTKDDYHINHCKNLMNYVKPINRGTSLSCRLFKLTGVVLNNPNLQGVHKKSTLYRGAMAFQSVLFCGHPVY